jgi:hypothetical protein
MGFLPMKVENILLKWNIWNLHGILVDGQGICRFPMDKGGSGAQLVVPQGHSQLCLEGHTLLVGLSSDIHIVESNIIIW